MLIYDRKSKKYIEDEQYGGDILNYLYNTAIGRCLLKIAINPGLSKIYGLYQKSPLSKKKIKKFIDKYNIDINLYEHKKYSSFNDFFTRKPLKINIDYRNKSLVSPCDSKLLVYNIDENLKINIKGSIYSIKELLKSNYNGFKNGKCLVFRLSMDDLHRYYHIDDGKILKRKNIKGQLHTVSSISKDYKIYKENKRVCTLMETKNFGKIIQIEVGALLVGDICNNNARFFHKGQEKGYFSIGGSTIILLINDVKIDDDIIENSKNGFETKIYAGEKIGEKI